MANGATHLLAGGIAGAGVALLDKGPNGESKSDPLVGFAVGSVFGKLPDILEPSLGNPNHRQFCHSLVFLAGVGWGIKKVYDWKPESTADGSVHKSVSFP